jgi:YidC/Oxa1 family membrane protein insertase
MQEQGKRLLLACALALTALLLWQMLFPDKKPAHPPGQGSGSAGSAMVQPSSVAPTPPPATSNAASGDKRGEEKLIPLTYKNVEFTFSTYGGALKSVRLTDKRYEKDKWKGELLPQAKDTGAFLTSFPNSTYDLPQLQEWTCDGTAAQKKVVCTFSTDTLSVEKTFDIYPEFYLVKATIKTTVLGKDARQYLAVTIYGKHDPKDTGGGGRSVQPRVWDSATIRGGEHWETGVNAVIKAPRYEYNIKWSGFEHPFMLSAIAPRPMPGRSYYKQTFGDASGLMRTDIITQPQIVPNTAMEYAGYFGPKNYKELEDANGPAGWNVGFNDCIDLGWFAFIGRPLMWLLLKFYGFVGNWGIAIMLLTLLVKLLTIPFTTRSMRSMKAIAVLAPELKLLQEKYADDRQRLQMETMALYRQHGANPLSGCLPIFLQMPIWLALYRMLSSTGELYQMPFIRGWINDLTAEDPTHILPIALMITMFLQARLQPSAPSTDPAQKMQQRMMQYGLPIMFGVMSFFFPAGLALYIFTNTCLSAVHSIYMNKFDKKSLELSARIEAAKKKAEDEKNKSAAAKAKDANTDDDDEDDASDDDAPKALAKPAGNKPRPGGQNRPKGGKKKKRR